MPLEIAVQAYQLESLGRPEGIVMRERAEPKCGPTDIVVRIRAASLNRRDVMILRGTYPLAAKPDATPLSDGAGEVVAIGGAVTRFKIGDRVTGSYFARWRDGRLSPDLVDQLGCTLDGMLAEYVVLDEHWAVAVPDHLTWEEAATLTCAGVTAWNCIVGSGTISPGQTILTLGTGGVSLFAVQFAKMMGCRVIAATSRDRKIGKLRALGADHVIDTVKTPQWALEARSLTNGEGVDLVVETNGPDTLEQSIIAAALYGQIVLLITRSAERPTLEIPGNSWANSLAGIRRVFVGSRADLERMNRAIATHRMRPVIDRVFPFVQAREAYDYFMQGDVFGKVVVLGA
jgi:NADPH:quinone reductase-like Zn-dependent oxidoreductase